MATISGGLWTDEDLTELIRLVKKYPIGTLSRWETIAEYMNRSVQEVTFMAARMKETGYRVPGEPESVAENIVQDATKKVKSVVTEQAPKAAAKVSDTFWSQDQQKLLETAIVTYSKSTVGDRWQKIANAVPGKTKEECLARYKRLVEVVKAQKASEAAAVEAEAKGKGVEDANANGDANLAEESENVVTKPEPVAVKKEGGKPRNKRKEKKKQMDFSSDEDDL